MADTTPSTGVINIDAMGKLYEVMDQRQHEEPNSHLSRAFYQVGRHFFQLGKMEKAFTFYRRALKGNLDSIDAYHRIIRDFEKMSRLDDAWDAMNILLKLGDRSCGTILCLARLEYRAKNFARARELLKWLVRENSNHPIMPKVHYLLSKVYDRSGAFDEAFQAARYFNNEMLHSTDAEALRVSYDRYVKNIIQMCTWLTPRSIAAWRPGKRGDGFKDPVFLVGFPRSGATLLEQILNTHTAVVATGEEPLLDRIVEDFWESEEKVKSLADLSPETIRAYRSDFRERLQQITGEIARNRTVVYKLPQNVVYLAHIYRFFPQAPIIVTLRDPRDVVISHFLVRYQSNYTLYYSLSLEETARLYVRVMKLYLHYREVLPLKFIEIRYEDVVVDLEKALRSLLDELGLSWEHQMDHYYDHVKQQFIYTPNYDQVTQPIYRHAVSRWRNYQRYLEPVQPILAPLVKAFGYESAI